MSTGLRPVFSFMYSMSFLIFTAFKNKGAVQIIKIIRPNHKTTLHAEEDLSLYIIDAGVAFASTIGGAASIELGEVSLLKNLLLELTQLT